MNHVSPPSARLIPPGLLGLLALFVTAAVVGAGAQSSTGPTAALCAMLTVAVVSWYSPQRATRVVLMLLFVTPFLMVTPQLRPDEFNYSAIFCLAAAPVAAVVCARARKFRLDSGALLLAIILLSAFVTLLTNGSLVSSYSYLLWPLTTLAVYLMVLNAAESAGRQLITALLAFALVEALLGLSQSLLQWPVFSFATPVLYTSDRGLLGYILPGFTRFVGNGSGTFQHFNGLGSLLALSLPIAFGRVLDRPRSTGRLLLFAVLAVALLMTYSRGGWIGGAIGCLLAYWMARPRESRQWIPVLVAVGLLAAALAAPYLAAYYGATQNVSSRILTWRYGVTYWLDHPPQIPFGAGFGSFQQSILAQRVTPGGLILSALHSSFLQILLEIGVLGMLLFAWFLITTLSPFLRDRRPSWQSWALAGMLGFLVSQLFDNALFGLTGTLFFALAACLRRPDGRAREIAAQAHDV